MFGFGKKVAGSSFGRVADQAASIKDAEGKIEALRNSNKVQSDKIADLKSQAKDLHKTQDAIDSELSELHALLG